MKNLHAALIVALAAGCLNACAPPAPPVSASSQMTASTASETSSAQQPEEGEVSEQGNSLLAQIDALYAQLDTTPLPLLENDRYSLDPNHGVDELPPQLAIDTPEAYVLSNQIRNYLYFGGNILEDFNNPNDAYFPAMLQTALYHATPIDLTKTGWDWNSEEYLSTDSNHVVALLIKQEIENGRMPSDVYYASEVEAVVHHLFGDEREVFHFDQSPYYHFKKAGLYTRLGDFGGPAWVYPQMTLIEKTATGYVCEAVMVSALEKDTPMETRDGVILTRENFEQASINSPKYRYTLREEADGRLTLQAFQTLRNPNRENAKG